MKESIVVLSGARLTSKGLHLGHFLGCFQPIIMGKIKNYTDYFFVIADGGKQDISESEVKHYVAEIYAIAKVFDLKSVHVVFESELSNKYYPIRAFIESIITCNQLFDAYRIEYTQARTVFKNRRVTDMMFPLNQAAINIAFNTSFVCMNDDNLRIVEFSRDINKKLNRLYKDDRLNTPTLVTGSYPHLMGYNYKKMCNGNENAIYLDDTREVLEFKVHLLFNHKRYFNAYPDEYVKFKDTSDYKYSENYLPIYFMNALFSDVDIEERYYMNNKKNASDENYLKTPLIDLIGNIRSETINIQNDSHLQKLLEMDLNCANRICDQNTNIKWSK